MAKEAALEATRYVIQHHRLHVIVGPEELMTCSVIAPIGGYVELGH
jgi:hypothetical protein